MGKNEIAFKILTHALLGCSISAAYIRWKIYQREEKERDYESKIL